MRERWQEGEREEVVVRSLVSSGCASAPCSAAMRLVRKVVGGRACRRFVCVLPRVGDETPRPAHPGSFFSSGLEGVAASDLAFRPHHPAHGVQGDKS